jgi:serine/threonine-protein kinase
VNANEYLGKQLEAVRAALVAQGLQVSEDAQESSQPENTVIKVSPTGTLRKGELVRLTYAVPPAAPSTSASPTSEAPSSSTSSAPATTAPASPSSSATTTASPEAADPTSTDGPPADAAPPTEQDD